MEESRLKDGFAVFGNRGGIDDRISMVVPTKKEADRLERYFHAREGWRYDEMDIREVKYDPIKSEWVEKKKSEKLL